VRTLELAKLPLLCCLLATLGCSGSTARPAPKTQAPKDAGNSVEHRGAEGLLESFDRGAFDAVISECQSLGKDAPSGPTAWCVGLVPASHYAVGRDSAALSRISELCAPLPAASPASDARAAVIALVMFCLAEANRTGHFERDQAQRSALMSSWLSACEVSEADIQLALERAKQDS
jgi:hypothetical protein